MRIVPRFLAAACLGPALALLALACGDEPSGPEPGAFLTFSAAGLPPNDADVEGRYELWVYGAGGTPVSVGRFDASAAGTAMVGFESPAGGAVRAAVTLEPPGDADATPSPYVLLAGRFEGARARLSLEGSVTRLGPLVAEPGGHSLFTSSNNVAMGYPSYEDAGLWLFNIFPAKNPHGTREVRLAPVQPGWIYEGWLVHRIDSPDAAWISYGKFRPDAFGLLRSRDDTGSGPYSGDPDYRNGGVEDVPGDEWTTDHLGLGVPAGLTLPLELDAVDPATGQAVWTHVITVEPVFDEGEALYTGRPFLRPYRNPIGAGGPEMPRFIQYQDNAPVGEIRFAR